VARGRAGAKRCEFIIGILESPCVKRIVLLARLSTGRWFMIAGTERGVFQFRGR